MEDGEDFGDVYEFFKEEIKVLRRNPDDYVEVERPGSRDSFRVMERFINTLEDSNPLKSQLIHALNRKNPFSNFKVLVDGSGAYRQQWFDFRDEEMREWVRNQVRGGFGKEEDSEEDAEDLS